VILLPCPRPFPRCFAGSGCQSLLCAARQPTVALDLDAIGQRPNEEIACQPLWWRFPVKPPPEIMDRITAKARKIGDPDIVDVVWAERGGMARWSMGASRR
jgi:hypothetical protein